MINNIINVFITISHVFIIYCRNIAKKIFYKNSVSLSVASLIKILRFLVIIFFHILHIQILFLFLLEYLVVQLDP